MAVIVEFTYIAKRPIRAVVRNGEWECEDADTLHMLESSTQLTSYRIHHHDPDPDYLTAELVIKDLSPLKGRIIYADPAPEASQGQQGM